MFLRKSQPLLGRVSITFYLRQLALVSDKNSPPYPLTAIGNPLQAFCWAAVSPVAVFTECRVRASPKAISMMTAPAQKAVLP